MVASSAAASADTLPTAAGTGKSYPTVTIAKGKARLFYDGNPLVFGGAVAAVTGRPAQCDVVEVKSDVGKLIGWGVFNAESMFRVRILAFASEEPLGASRDIGCVVEARVRTARAARAAIGLPSAATDAYRCVNGEGDRLSGLVVDVFGTTVGVSSSALWVESHRPAVEAALRRAFGDEYAIVWRLSDGRLQQDGWGEEEAAEEAGAERADVPPPLQITELGLKYYVQPHIGQKTGFYCDQRENREAVRRLAAGKTVLDMFCYSGGFALNAAAGGAAAVTAVDSSQGAVDAGAANAEANGLRVAFEKADALKWMEAAVARGEKYDMVILDPPKLAPNKKSLPRALGRYRRINALGLQLVAPGGLLLTFSCSAAMTHGGGFVDMVRGAALQVARPVTLLRALSAAADHVVNPAYPEGAYLTGGVFFCP
ncbi:ribosomal RNA large subunit methyltransferase I-like protein [Tribonema minus]|uniref:Ribosomal RNA large subunit methyltransferase I-like protein n=1 Tax=Tribonema minus TaxID=303371 RepID=A0A836CPI8_9STRA|nr:ribosomal RNA large subunit methyltransferase I-like protein [Tribonema minus]